MLLLLTDTNTDIKVEQKLRNRPEEDRQTVTETEGEVALEWVLVGRTSGQRTHTQKAGHGFFDFFFYFAYEVR